MDAEPAATDNADEPELSGPARLCALTRTVRPIEELVRFGAGLDGIVVPDLGRKLPGRGVWVELSRARLQEAVRRNVFAKSLKRAVTAAPDLPDRVEALLVKRVLEALPLANKAALVIPGTAKVEEALDRGQVVAIFHGSDAAAGGQEKLDRKFRAVVAGSDTQGLIVTDLTIEQISLAIGRANVVHAAIISGGAAARLLDEAKRLNRFRDGPQASPMALTPYNL